ncbi:MAG: glutathione ABC transporter substrate-binding protein [Chloroflexi bacterium]|nr:glutathione ABC transporter substrate-binding protein [Chloroflexota bacterium]
MVKHKKLWLVLGLMVIAAMLLASCGPAPTPTPVPPTPTPKPQILNIVTGTDIESLMIHRVTSSPSFTVLEHIFEPLFQMTADGKIEPLLAESFAATGATEYTIKLRKGVKFTDGTPFNAAAVKANLDWILKTENKAAFRSPLVDMVTEVKTPADDTVVLTTKFSIAPLQYHLTHGGVAMVSPAALAKGEEFLAANAIGTGPFKLKEWKKGEYVTLERNAEYWGTKPKLDQAIFKMVKEDGARLVAVESGAADVAVRVPPAEMARLKANKDLVVDVTPGLRTIYIFFNIEQKPFTDKRVRQAVNYGVDKKAIVEKLLAGAGRVSDAPMAPPIFGYSAQKVYERDVEKAKSLLKEAGIAPGTKVVLHHPTGRYVQDAMVADAVRTQLKEIGLDVELKTLEWGTYVPFVRAEREKNTTQFAMLGWSTPTMDADYALYSLFHKANHPPGFNGAFYDNPKVNELLEKGRSVTNSTERQVAYAEAIKIIWDDAPWLFLYSEVQVTAIRANVSNFVVHPSERMIVRTTEKK